jgi:adenine-specific DNA-methyltransferase
VATVAVLYISDDVVGPHLQLLRNICDPKSKSKPHVTVRYAENLAIPLQHLTRWVDHIDVIEPGAFGVDDEWSQLNRTVYLRCESDQLTDLEHKPDYPNSVFHVTLYDGHSLDFARSLLKVIRSFEWRFRVPLPPSTTLSTIQVKGKRALRTGRRPPFPPEARKLFEELTSRPMTRRLVENLNDAQRLDLAEAICTNLHDAIGSFERVPRRPFAGGRKEDQPPSVNKGDVHLTPPELAEAVARYAVDLLPANTPVHFGDPAVGTGAFYGALLQVLPRERIGSAIGVDISPEQVDSAYSRWSHRGMDVELGDYLHMGRLSHRSLILANPPYRRHHAIPPDYKWKLRERASVEVGINVDGRAGLYVYFLLLTHEWMEQDAIAAWLIPSEFMQSNYGAAVRYYLTHLVQLIRVHRFDHHERHFENAEVLPAVVVFRNRKPNPDDEALLSEGGTLQSPAYCVSAPFHSLRSTEKWVISRAPEPCRESAIYIGDLFSVRRGIATGANDFFVLTRSEADRRRLPSFALKPVLPKARTLSGDIVERASDGYPLINPQLCMLDCDIEEQVIELQFPELAAYLAEGKARGLLTRNLISRRKPWYRQEQRSPAQFLCTSMGRGNAENPPIRFLLNKSDAVATNTYTMMYPRTELAQLLREQPHLEIELLDVLRETSRASMRHQWRIHAGGLIKMEPNDLLRVPIHSCPEWLAHVVQPRL